MLSRFETWQASQSHSIGRICDPTNPYQKRRQPSSAGHLSYTVACPLSIESALLTAAISFAE